MDLNHAMELEELKAQLTDSKTKFIQCQNEMSNVQNMLIDENMKLKDDLNKLHDRYDRLMESHKKLQKNNHMLECNLLDVVEKLSEEKRVLQEDVRLLTIQLLDAKHKIYEVTEKLLFSDAHAESNDNVCNKGLVSRGKMSKMSPVHQQTRFPISTFPPTAICYSSSESKLYEMANDCKASSLRKSDSITLNVESTTHTAFLDEISTAGNSPESTDFNHNFQTERLKIHHV